MTQCDRCHTEAKATIVSKFNTDVICPDCKDDETQAPGHAHAAEVEEAHVRSGDYSFAGVGLSAEDLSFLAARRAARGEDKHDGAV
jgi:hypothetical protein